MADETGRERAQDNPFWATALSSMAANDAAIVRGLYGIVKQSPLLAPYVWMGSGYRPDSEEHSKGAIDVMFTADTGMRPNKEEQLAADLFVAWVVKNGHKFGAQWILYAIDGKVTHSYNFDRGSWKKLSDRGGISANHIDHAHIFFKPEAAWDSSLSIEIIGGNPAKPTKPVTPTTGGILGMSNFKNYSFSQPQKKKAVNSYLSATKEGWWKLSAPAGPVAISVHGYATAGNNCQIFIQAELDDKDSKTVKSRTIGRVALPVGTGSYGGSAVAVLQPSEVIRLRLANHSGKEVTISNVTANILHS